MEFLSEWAHEFWLILFESGAWLLVGFAAAGLAHAVMPMGWVRRQLGGRGVAPVFKAALLGVPLPLCSCSVIPAAAMVRKQGASRGATASFAISTPETGAETIAFTWGLLGPILAIARPIGALLTAFLAGVTINAIDGQDDDTSATSDATKHGSCCHSAAPPVSSCCTPALLTPTVGDSCCHGEASSKQRDSIGARLVDAVRYGFLRMPEDLALWLLLGLALSALIGALIPPDWIGDTIGTGLGPMLLMLVVGIPVYVCASASTPVAASLVVKGLSPGAAIVFLLAGPATNMATISWVLKDLGVKALAVYLSSIAIVAVGAGLVIDAIGPDMASVIPMAHEHGDQAAWKLAAGGALALLLLVGGMRRVGRLLGNQRAPVRQE